MAKSSPRDLGYRAFLAKGLSARNPFKRQIISQEQWQQGFQKARDEHTPTQPQSNGE